MTKDEIASFLDREELQLASIGKRALAHAIDSILLLTILIIIDLDTFLALQNSLNQELYIAWMEQLVLYYLPLTFVYQIVFVSMYGATLGKMAMKITVINIKTGETPNFDVAVNRSIVRILSEIIYNLGFLWGSFDTFKQSWHDKTASTLVIDA